MNTLKSTVGILAIIFLCAFQPSGELQWQTWNDGSKVAEKKKKILLVDVYTDWCGWCKVMDKNTYANSEVIDLVNADFIPVKFNPETPGIIYKFMGKDMDGPAFAAALSNNQISGYPATVFYFPKKKEAVVQIGYKNAEEFKRILGEMVAKEKGPTK